MPRAREPSHQLEAQLHAIAQSKALLQKLRNQLANPKTLGRVHLRQQIKAESANLRYLSEGLHVLRDQLKFQHRQKLAALKAEPVRKIPGPKPPKARVRRHGR